MTQQKPLPIATRITGGFNIPSFFYPEVLQRDKIWHMPLGKKARRQKNNHWWTSRKEGGAKTEAWARRKSSSFGEGVQAPVFRLL